MKDEMVCLEPFDWRYSAAIVGLRKYLEWLGVDEEPNLIITEDTLEYNKKYLDKEDFLKFDISRIHPKFKHSSNTFNNFTSISLK